MTRYTSKYHPEFIPCSLPYHDGTCAFPICLLCVGVRWGGTRASVGSFLPEGVRVGPCWKYNFLDFFHAVFVRATRIYLPVHFIPGLLFKRKHVLKKCGCGFVHGLSFCDFCTEVFFFVPYSPLAFIRESLVAVLRSSLFLGSYTSIVKMNICFWRNYIGRRVPAVRKIWRESVLVKGFSDGCIVCGA